MYKFVPQKKRSNFRVKLGVLFYSTLRYFLWIRFSSRFTRKINFNNFEEQHFPYIVFAHETPLKRNLSKEDMDLQEGKVENLKLAVKCISPIILKPNQIFSYWRLIGNPTKIRGFKKGMMLVNGQPTSAIGGGLCALSNLIYWATLHTDLTVIERFRHSYDVFPDSNRTLPFGSGATCVYNYRDLMIQNRTTEDFLLKVWIDEIEQKLKCEWRTKSKPKTQYEVYQKEHWFTQELNHYIRHNTIFRKCFSTENNSKILKSDDFITENHALMMYEPLLEKK